MMGKIKMKPVVVCNNKTHRSFKGVKNLPVEYVIITIAWIAASVFEDYICNWARKGKKKLY
jgi:hypothetical protein